MTDGRSACLCGSAPSGPQFPCVQKIEKKKKKECIPLNQQFLSFLLNCKTLGFQTNLPQNINLRATKTELLWLMGANSSALPPTVPQISAQRPAPDPRAPKSPPENHQAEGSSWSSGTSNRAPLKTNQDFQADWSRGHRHSASCKAGKETSRVQPRRARAGEGRPGQRKAERAAPTPTLQVSDRTQSELGRIAYRKPGGCRKTYCAERAATGPRLRRASRQGQTRSLGP